MRGTKSYDDVLNDELDRERARRHARRLLDDEVVALEAAARPADLPTDWGGGDMHEILASTDPEFDWLAPGLLERGERVIVTGPEGKGKSTLLRQIAYCLASGVDPFTTEALDAPLRVLVIDLENDEAILRRKLRALNDGLDFRPNPGQLIVRTNPAGLDLSQPDDRALLIGYCAKVAPDLLVIGPLYKMTSGDQKDEREAMAIARTLDRIRTDVGCAVVIEAHSPHATPGNGRPMRPVNSSVWLRWPNVGFNLAENGAVFHWRGQREVRSWPGKLRHGGGAADTWVVDDDGLDDDGVFRPHGQMERASAFIESENIDGRDPSQNDITTAIGGKRTVALRAINELIALGHVDSRFEGSARRHRSIRPYMSPVSLRELRMDFPEFSAGWELR